LRAHGGRRGLLLGDGSFNALGDGMTNGHLSKKPVLVR
jgi:hypothetical protein